jgi:hypothetical protein
MEERSCLQQQSNALFVMMQRIGGQIEMTLWPSVLLSGMIPSATEQVAVGFPEGVEFVVVQCTRSAAESRVE